ncbi:hypothetical protein HY418_00265 [Candidatus Kaiserbacteria bacterium]|nr:hypothetical protein [Candidatus Kaiserbacteria bacterium]
MPPQSPIQQNVQSGKKPSSGPMVGIVIIVLLMIVGALYFWGARLNQQNAEDQLPLIPADSPAGESTTTPQ